MKQTTVSSGSHQHETIHIHVHEKNTWMKEIVEYSKLFSARELITVLSLIVLGLVGYSSDVWQVQLTSMISISAVVVHMQRKH